MWEPLRPRETPLISNRKKNFILVFICPLFGHRRVFSDIEGEGAIPTVYSRTDLPLNPGTFPQLHRPLREFWILWRKTCLFLFLLDFTVLPKPNRSHYETVHNTFLFPVIKRTSTSNMRVGNFRCWPAKITLWASNYRPSFQARVI